LQDGGHSIELSRQREEAAAFWRLFGLRGSWAWALVKTGILTAEQLRAATDRELYLVNGIGPNGLAAITSLRERLRN
jgi:hypothetical protein